MIVNTICLTKGLEDGLATQTQKAEHTLPESFHRELKHQLPPHSSFLLNQTSALPSWSLVPEWRQLGWALASQKKQTQTPSSSALLRLHRDLCEWLPDTVCSPTGQHHRPGAWTAATGFITLLNGRIDLRPPS